MKPPSEVGGYLVADGLGRFIPEPKNRMSTFGAVLKGVGNVLSAGASSIAGLDPGYQGLLEKQIEVQQQMQVLSMESNIEKSKHETQMTAIRNIRSS